MSDLSIKKAILTSAPLPLALAEVFTRLEIDSETFAHAPVFTVSEGREIKELLPGGHTKNLFLKDKKGKIWLIVADEATVINLKTLHRYIGSDRLSFGSPDLLKEILGVIPGSVTPFSLINDINRRVTVLLDAFMMSQTRVHYHPLRNDMTTVIATTDLQKFLCHLGYTPQVIDFAGLETN